VFVIAIFDPVLANNCPDPLLPVSESLPRHLAKSKPKRQSASRTLTEGIRTDGAIVNSICGETYHHGGITNQDLSSGHMVVEGSAEWWDGRDTAEALTTTSNEQRMPDKHRFQAVIEQDVVGTLTVSDLVKQVNNEIIGKGLLQVVENRQPYTPSSFAQYKEEDMNAVATLRAGGGDLGGGSEVLIAEPYVKSSRAQTSEDSETWISSEVNPTLNSFDQGDVRTTTAIVGSLQARDFKGVNHEGARDGKLIIEEPLLFENSYRDGARIANDGITQTLSAKMGTGGGNTPMIAIPIQDGREIEKHQNGLGVADEGSPAYTLDQTGAQAVAYPIHPQATSSAGNSRTNKDGRGNGLGVGSNGDPSTSIVGTTPPIVGHAVAYDEYNDTTNDVHQALRAGTKQSTGVLMFQDSEFGVKEYDTAGTLRAGRIPEHQMIGEVTATLRSGGDGGVPSSRGEHLVIEPTLVNENITSPTLTAYNMDSRSPQSEEQQRIVNAVFETTMAVRRLTPLECERLMGWPDDHTRYKADGTEQADTHRYKQCGNGVASPVAQWIGKHLLKLVGKEPAQ
jgi:hypothetical protein